MAVARAAKRQKLLLPENRQTGKQSTKIHSQLKRPSQEDFIQQAAGWNLEQNYEQRPRKQNRRDSENVRLPIKTAEGRVQALHMPEVKEGDANSWLASEDGDVEGVIDEQPSEPAQVAPEMPIRQQILDAKEELARIASHINEDPEEHAGGFQALARLTTNPHPTIKKLALATNLAVYKDAIPGYRIRPIAEADQTEKVSKEVRRLRAFEQSLISAYQAYLKELAQCANARPKSDEAATAGVATVAISCACALLLAVPHFNFRGELLKILVTKLSSRRRDTDFNKCFETIERFFRNDEDGTPSLDAVLLLTRMMKARSYQIDEGVLNTFLQLRLLSEFSSKASQNHIDKPDDQDGSVGKKSKIKREFRTKKHRKILKERKVVEKEFKEADAIVSHEQRDKMQAETLKLVFVTYFRILKARIPHLMGAVLEGLAKYAHLINQDFFGDLLEALKDLISDAEASLRLVEEEDEEQETSMSTQVQRDTVRESLLCTATAFTLLEGQDAAKAASSLNLDLTCFTTHLYKSLHALALNPDIELSSKSLRLPDPHTQPQHPGPTNHTSKKVNVQTTTVLLLRALSSTLTPRTVPPTRIAAFTKQLYTTLLHLPEKSNLALLGILTNVTKTHGRKIAALWNTEERKGDGVFDPFRPDLEASNPFASTIWEGELLKVHFCPGVREAASGVERIVGAAVK